MQQINEFTFSYYNNRSTDIQQILCMQQINEFTFSYFFTFYRLMNLHFLGTVEKNPHYGGVLLEYTTKLQGQQVLLGLH